MFSYHPPPSRHYSASLYTRRGERKYLSQSERQRFINCAKKERPTVQLLCLSIVLSGCRLSEALNLKTQDVLSPENAILVRSLKKRDKLEFRQIPLPSDIVASLTRLNLNQNKRLFPWKRTQALAHIKRVMASAEIAPVRANARALRHTFATHGLRHGIPLTLMQRWLGHSKIEITAIYTQILGPEEREIAEKMW